MDPSKVAGRGTRARDESYLRSLILPVFGPHQLSKIDHLAVRGWVADLERSGLAPATTVKAAQILGKVMGAAVDAALIARSPCLRVPLPKVEREEMRFLLPAEVARLAETIHQRYRPLVLLGAYSGLRPGELFALRRSRLDLLRSRVEVAETVVEVSGHHVFGPPKTRAGRRSVPLPRSVTDELAAVVAHLAPGDLVFTAPQGGPIRASLLRRRFWQPAVERAGISPLRLHDMRHTAVAFWIAAGASAREVCARAGHTSAAVVLDRYGHLLPGGEERVTEALEAMVRAGFRESAGGGQVVNLGGSHGAPAASSRPAAPSAGRPGASHHA